MKVVVDNNLPYSLAQLLRASKIDAIHVLDVKLADVDDNVLRKHFASEEIIFLTRDNDFWENHPAPWAIVWLALHNPKLREMKGPICKTLSSLIPSLRPGQKVLMATDQIRVFS
jgi:predicted nuclease of predicted toxin-antitoxin system